MRLLICEQHTLFREGIKAVLLTHPSIEVVGTASDGRQAVERALGTRPDVVLMDISMSLQDDFSGVDFITQTDSDIKVLIFTDSEEQELLEQCLNSGASGFVRKDATSQQLIEALQAVHLGGTYFMAQPANCGHVSGHGHFRPKNLIDFPASN